MALSTRLLTLFEIITLHPNRYPKIWDSCCDHGLLGLELLKQSSCDTVYFNDCVPALLAKLPDKLADYPPHQWQLLCQDARTLDIPKQSSAPLIIIAGVGGELAAQLVTTLSLRHPEQPLDFLLCPVHHCYQLRQQLTDLNYGLLSERLIQENGRFYEALHIAKLSSDPITLTGHSIWLENEAEIYHQRLIEHYQRRIQNPMASTADHQALKAYQQLQLTR